MSFARLHKLVAYLLSGLGLIALSLGTELEPDVIVLMFLGYFGSLFAEGKLLEHPYYARGWTALVVFMLCVQLIRAVTTEPTLAMAIEFAAFLQISRLWNRRTAADYQQIAVLSFLHLIAATVLSTSLSYAVIFIGFVIVTPWMLALSQLRREIEGNYPASVPNDERAQAAVRRVLASRRVVGASFLLNTALLALPLFAMTLAIFVVVPRVGQGFLNLQRSRGQRVAGFGNQIELGGFGVIRDDPTVVLRVTPLPRVDEKAPRLSLRMRGTSFDRYDGKRWTRSSHPALLLPTLDRENYTIRRSFDRSRDQRMQIVLDHLDEAVVFLPYGTVAVSVPPRTVHAQQIARELLGGPGLDVRYEDPDELGLVYTAYVSREAEDAVIPPSPAERRARYLQLPKGHERIAALAQQLTAGTRSDSESAQRLLTYLHSNRFKYSLSQPDVKGKPPLDAFLFDAHRGHCEYFASAMAIMLRTLGIPSRNVTGFVGGRYNPYGGYYALRQGDAHSWVEAYIDGRGWVTFDPTPSARADLGPRQNLWADLQAFTDALRTRWMTSVVGYDLRAQVSMLRKLANLFSSSERHSSTSDPGSHAELDALKRFGKFVLLVVIGVGFVVGAFVLRARRARQVKRVRPMAPQVAEAVRLYQELDKALMANGRARPAALTPIEHARALEKEGFMQASEVREVTESYMRVRYGGGALPGSELALLRAAISRVKRAPRPEQSGRAR
jgi:transglutaminase-like putative cysteine protease